MGRISNGVVTGLNVLAIVLAFSAIGFSVWFQVKAESRCQRVLKRPLLIFGVALLVVSAAGMVGSWFRVSFILWVYLLMLFLLIIALITLTVFTIMVTNKRVGTAVSGDHRLAHYSTWLQNYVINARNWDEIKSCLVGVKLCQANYQRNITPLLQSGCCKPPSYCGFEFHNATYWTPPKTGPAAADPDCKTWSNGQEELCFDCYSCKKAVLDNIRREWRLMALINIAIILFVIVVYSLGCCALRNNHHEHHRAQLPA
ncbi:hypothetical protein ACS0TY_023842 [Phlomoides rotata]